jgi:hypothetical protein
LFDKRVAVVPREAIAELEADGVVLDERTSTIRTFP